MHQKSLGFTRRTPPVFSNLVSGVSHRCDAPRVPSRGPDHELLDQQGCLACGGRDAGWMPNGGMVDELVMG